MTVEEREFREKMGLSRQAAPRGAVTIPHVEHPIPADTHAYPSAGRRATQRGGRLGLIWRGQDIHIKAVMSHAGLSRMRDRLDAIDALIKDD
ncbi:hypothetical protein HZF05_04185 [Sphingomonas sp. CGMCC 1.13654]|uniref:Uncharacterized protein n=1 Tax=Sphingomonas chungangi TaxID=2683589 RepID=A0A838L2J6_9SPHN|nr:hypothetical protein [Sphingomonas chungangi]MBA2933287.1 hypothetical protein [Sphingomonas chungangi]MVW57957.1 hypothetical protein [Sphingomonas chungangi]